MDARGGDKADHGDDQQVSRCRMDPEIGVAYNQWPGMLSTWMNTRHRR